MDMSGVEGPGCFGCCAVATGPIKFRVRATATMVTVFMAKPPFGKLADLDELIWDGVPLIKLSYRLVDYSDALPIDSQRTDACHDE